MSYAILSYECDSIRKGTNLLKDGSGLTDGFDVAAGTLHKGHIVASKKSKAAFRCKEIHAIKVKLS